MALIQAVLLSGILVHRVIEKPTPPAVGRFNRGDTVGLPMSSELEADSFRVILAFRTTCPFVSQVTGIWKDWIDANDNATTVFLATDELASAAEAFMDSVGWRGMLLGAGNEQGVDVGRLTLRTPWVFVLDRSGMIVSDFNGVLLPGLSLGDGGLDTTRLNNLPTVSTK